MITGENASLLLAASNNNLVEKSINHSNRSHNALGKVKVFKMKRESACVF